MKQSEITTYLCIQMLHKIERNILGGQMAGWLVCTIFLFVTNICLCSRAVIKLINMYEQQKRQHLQICVCKTVKQRTCLKQNPQKYQQILIEFDKIRNEEVIMYLPMFNKMFIMKPTNFRRLAGFLGNYGNNFIVKGITMSDNGFVFRL